jgi:hypothetical protein
VRREPEEDSGGARCYCRLCLDHKEEKHAVPAITNAGDSPFGGGTRNLIEEMTFIVGERIRTADLRIMQNVTKYGIADRTSVSANMIDIRDYL